MRHRQLRAENSVPTKSHSVFTGVIGTCRHASTHLQRSAEELLHPDSISSCSASRTATPRCDRDGEEAGMATCITLERVLRTREVDGVMAQLLEAL